MIFGSIAEHWEGQASAWPAAVTPPAAAKSAMTRAALCAGRGTAFSPRCARRHTAQKAASRGIPLAAALQIFSS